MDSFFIRYRFCILLIIIVLSAKGVSGQNNVAEASCKISSFRIDEENIALSGKWEFYQNQLLTYENFKANTQIKFEYIQVPGLWNKQLKSGSKGYGTYRLKMSGLTPGELYAFQIIRLQSSYKLFVDSTLLYSNGIVGTSKSESKPKWSSDVILYKPEKKSADIILQVSNFYHKKGGIENPILFGKSQNIIKESDVVSYLNFFLLGALLIMAAYHLGLFMFRKNDKLNLYFAFTLIFSAVFSLTDGNILLTQIFPEFNWEFLLKIHHGSNYLRALFFILFIYLSFKDYFKKTIVKIYAIIVILIQLVIILTTADIYSHLLIVFFIITGFGLIYLFIGQFRALKDKKVGTIYSLLGIAVLILTVTNDILKEYGVINTISLAVFGIFIFIIFHSYLISIQNSKAYSLIKKITENLLIQGQIKDALFAAESFKFESPLKTISEVLEVDRSLIFTSENNEWITNNEYLKAENEVKSLKVKMFSSKEDVFFSAFNVKKAIASKTSVYTLSTDNLTAKDIVYFMERGIKSIFTFPFVKDNNLQALLYFENFEIKPNFNQKSKELLEAILPQIFIFMENYNSYKQLKQFNEELEAKVQEVSDEIRNRNNELKIIRNQIEQQNIQTDKLNHDLEKQNQEINDGIKYAETIQQAFLPSEREISSVFSDNFIFMKSKSNLSGDFNWFSRISNTESIYIVADSTGHGVSGALMSIIGHRLLNEIILFKGIISPKLILNTLQKEFTAKFSEQNDVMGIDLSVVYYNSKNKEIVYSGAQNPVFIISNNNLIEIKASLISIGFTDQESIKEENKYFTNKHIPINDGDVLYLFSDGFYNQTGEETGRKFMKNKFKDLLLSVYKEPFTVQKQHLEKTFVEWKGKELQTDDILIAGIRF